MREIKFRAWDKVCKKWFATSGDYRYKDYKYLIAIGLHGLPISVSEDSFKSDEVIGWNRDHNIELMQYTGLKDKNGVEIYEDDVLHMPNKKKSQHVVFKRGFFQMPEYFIDETDEVIGNIYENPELLEQIKCGS